MLAVRLLALRVAATSALELGCESGTTPQRLFLLKATHSNLGGQGPDATPPDSLRFDAALGGEGRGGECVTLEITSAAGAEYEPESSELNGGARGAWAQKGDGTPGQVSVKSGSRADLLFQFFKCGTTEPAAMPRFNMTFYSPSGATVQRVTASGYAESYIRDSRVFSKSYTDDGTSFGSSSGCPGAVDSEECSFTLHYRGVHKFPVIFEAGEADVVEPFRFSGAACGPPPPAAEANKKVQSSSPCSPAVCGSGYELLPEEMLPADCKGKACNEDECCRLSSSEQPAQDEGQFPAVASCSGKEQQWHLCLGLPECEECEPQDCEFSEWDEWSPVGGCSGLCQRSRKPGENNECGKPCAGPSLETAVRLDDPDCFPEECSDVSVDCKWSEWSDWSECKKECTPCRLEQSFRSRQISEPSRGGGKDCEGVWNQTRPCQASHDQDCKMSQWAEWTECSKSCGMGWKARMRRVVQEALYGGKPCSGSGSQDEGVPTRETSTCNLEDCAKKVECVMAEWSDWAGCDSAQSFQKFRNRDILMPPANGAGGCNHVLNQTMGCPGKSDKQEDCTLSDWGEWNECSKSCDGQRYRSRSVQNSSKTSPCMLPEPVQLNETKPCGEDECYQNSTSCQLSEWSEWADCKGDCGMGVTIRLRHVISEGATAEPCEAILQEAKGCDTKHNCTKVDCQWATWESWSDCSATCGGGTTFRSRAVKAMPQHGGEPCAPEAKAEVASCGEVSCDNCIDGRWKDWSSWGECSGSCSPSYKVRHREVERHPNFCGKAAMGLEDDYALCEDLESCDPQEDCELSDWSSWTNCSCKCYGVRERQRHVTQMAAGGGESCFNESLKEVEPCNPGTGEEVPAGCGPDAPANCKVSEWDEWSECSASCDGGQRQRSRHVLSPASNGGSSCSDDLITVAPCGMDACNKTAKCQDCEWGVWSEWGDCSCAGQRYRQRAVARMPNSCGRPCEGGAGKETEACESRCDDKLYCAWSDWTDMGQCSATCGASTQMRQRSLSLTKTAKEYMFISDGSSPCNGNQIDVTACPFTPCDGQCLPTDCRFGAWSHWSEPSCSQLCSRKRAVETEGSCEGRLCNGPVLETKPCAKDCFRPKDCVLQPWTPWNTTDCNGSGQQYRNRGIEARAENGGTQCEGPLAEAKPCDVEKKPKVDCELADWDSWTACTEECGGGIATRSRQVITEASGGGELCHGGLDELKECNTEECDKVRPCKLGAWSQWSECADGEETTYRSRDIQEYPTQGGEVCSGALRESKACSLYVDCEVSAWTKWDECDKTCGGGQQVRQRFVVTNPRGGGRECPAALMEARGCAEEACSETDCTVSDWAEWSSCSSSCGQGARNRSREFTQRPCEGGVGCNMDLAEAAPCHGPPCECQDCKWGEWTEWSPCSKSCLGGQRSRQRNIEQAPQPGCKPCTAEVKEEMEPCNTQSCEDRLCIDGEWGAWTEWETCSSTCKGGWSWRSRVVQKEANECGQPALGPSQESKHCNDDVPCQPDVDCAFGDWGTWAECSAACAGVKRRERVVQTHGVAGGKACEGPLEQTEPCQTTFGLLDWQANEGYLELAGLTNNNLGYAGPGEAGSHGDDRLSQPPNIRFERALEAAPPVGCVGSDCDATVADLVIFPKSPYTPCDVGANGKQAPRLGSISVQSGSKVDLEFALVDSQTGSPVELKRFALKFFDLDQGAKGDSSEMVSARGFQEYRLVHNSEVVKAKDEQSGLTMFHAGAPAIATEKGPENATEAQERRSATLIYSRVAKVDVTLEVSPGSLCQSFVFAAKACVDGCELSDPCHNETLAVDCEYSDWSRWSDCSATCGSGQRARSRVVIQEAAGGGARCTGTLSETASCKNDACPGDCKPVACAWGDWSTWGECDRCGGQMTRSRKVLKHADCGGRACEPGAAVEIANCTRACHGRTWCIWEDWQSWGPCSASCGHGLQSRERHLKPSATPPTRDSHAAARSLQSGSSTAGLEGKFAKIQDRAQRAEWSRLQMLALAFAAGPASIAAVAAAARGICRRRNIEDSSYAPVFTGSSPACRTNSDARLLEFAPRARSSL